MFHYHYCIGTKIGKPALFYFRTALYNTISNLNLPGKGSSDDSADDLGWIDGLGGFFSQSQGEDYQETAFANRMKKKKKRRK